MCFYEMTEEGESRLKPLKLNYIVLINLKSMRQIKWKELFRVKFQPKDPRFYKLAN